MRRKHVQRLVDPVDGLPLELRTGSLGDAIDDGLLVGSSGREYRIVRGVARFVPDDEYVESFSFQWLTHARTQVDDATHRDSYDQFLQKTGFDASLVRGATVLDAGVGSGRFADVALKLGAAEVYGLDLSMAVDSAEKNLGQEGRFSAVQASIFSPPFADGSFDLIYSIGVLHHTPAPKLAFDRLVRLLRPGGRIAVFVYVNTPTHVVSDAIRVVTTRIRPEKLYKVISAVQPMLDRISDAPLGRAALRWLPRSTSTRRDWRVLETFDWYSPKYQFRYDGYEEICDWFKDAGLVDVRPLNFDICVQGRKPEI